MKKLRFITLILLIPSIFLVACGDEGGFSSGSKNNNYQENNNSNNSGNKEDTPVGGGGSGGQKDDENQNENENNNQNENPVGGNEEGNNTQPADLGTLITNFRASFVKPREDNYINLSFVKDPFVEEYNFAYYTINEEKLDYASFQEKEIIDSTETYKLFLGTNEPGSYIIKYFNNDNKQYGATEITIQAKTTFATSSYLSISFNLIQVRFYTISYTIQQHFKKIGDFFKSLFNEDHIRI